MLSRMSLGDRLAPGVAAAALLLPLALARLFASASPERVLIAGRALDWKCLFQKWFAIPCPTCGMTRSVLLTLQGQFAAAWDINPAGPLLVLGLLLFCAAMIFLTFYQAAARSPLAAGQVQRRIRLGSAAYAGTVVAVLLVHWLGEII